MSIIKQISVFNGSSWDTDNIGVNAGNVDLLSADGTTASTIAGSTNLLTGLNSILPANQLIASRALISDASGKIGTSNISTTILNTALSGASTSTSLQSQINTLNGKLVGVNITTNVLTYAQSLPAWSHAIVYYTGTDYSWCPEQSANFRYGMFIIDRTSAPIVVNAYSWNGALRYSNVYGNNAWNGWKIYSN